MNYKKRVLSAIFAMTLTLTACNHQTKPENVVNPTENIETTNTVTPGVVSEQVNVQGQAISVSDLKAKYQEDTESVMPLYNVEPDESFDFHFNVSPIDISYGDHVTVHTDSKCTDESKIYVYENTEEEDGGTHLTISPMSGVLLNDSEKNDYVYNEKNVWGNAAIYYLCVHYDTETDKKLEKPIIIPFTVKHEIPAPNVKGVVDSEGCFSLEWEPVEGATEYIIYNLVAGSDTIFGSNSKILGAETGYSNCSLLKEGETKECRYEGFSGEDTTRCYYERSIDKTMYVISQNNSVHGEYGVTAVVNGKEGPLGALVPTCDLKLPCKVVDEDDIMFGEVHDESELPLTVKVENIDGSITSRKVMYKYQTHTTYLDTQQPEYGFQIEGTAITGCLSLYSDDLNKVWPDSVNEFTPSGNVTPENNIPNLPDSDVQTIIPVTPDDGNDTEGVPDVNNEDPTTAPDVTNEDSTTDPDVTNDDPVVTPDVSNETPTQQPQAQPDNTSLYEQQMDNTQSHIAHGDSKTVTVANNDLLLFADSAAEEWLALNMASGETKFSVEAFPELQISNNLLDMFHKVYYQNPYILGVLGISYDYNTFEVSINYCYDKDTIVKKQKEIYDEANKISQQIITSDMDSANVEKTIYEYLESNCKYDDAALENAEKNNFQKTDNEFEDSFNAYGIIVNKVGVCQSYALAYKLLCQMNNVDCRVITGFLNGNLPHAWNVVNIDNKWYQVDTTNNRNNTGIPFFLYNCDSELALETGFTTDNGFELDTKVAEYTTDNAEHEYYHVQHMFSTDMNSFKEVLDKNLTDSEEDFCCRYESDNLNEQELVQTVREVYNMHGLENRLDTLKYAITNGYVVLFYDK